MLLRKIFEIKKPASYETGIYVRDRIRTHDLLVRSQTLYPAELHAHALYQRQTILYAYPTILSTPFLNFMLQFSCQPNYMSGHKCAVLGRGDNS